MRARPATFAAAALLGLALACFQAPDDDVIFACDPIADPRCPPGYACEADGCCHREGSDVQASWGACMLGGFETGTSETGTSETGTGSGTDTTSGTGTDTSTGDTSGTDTSGTDTTTG